MANDYLPHAHTADVSNKRVLLRVDLNVPMENGRVTDATRIERVLPTIREIADKGGKVILLAHFGRPKGRDPKDIARPGRQGRRAASRPARGFRGRLHRGAGRDGGRRDEARRRAAAGEHPLPSRGREERPRFCAGARRQWRPVVSDAFSAAHRAHASTEGLGHVLPAYAGRTMQAEVEALSKALEAPQRPVLAVVGGAKVSSKLELLGNLVKKVDILVIGGGMANTFLAAQGKAVGKSLCEKDLLDTARSILETAKQAGCEIVLPVDAVVAGEFKANAPSRVVSVDAVGPDDMILDIGPASVATVGEKSAQAKTLVWNGPFGAFELTLRQGTTAAASGCRKTDQRRSSTLRRGGRRHGFRAQSRGGGGGLHLCLDSRRRVPRMAGRQAAARRGHPASALTAPEWQGAARR